MLFWAEIYHQAKSLPSFILRPLFLAINGAVYAAQIGLWIYMGLAPKDRWVHRSCISASALRTELNCAGPLGAGHICPGKRYMSSPPAFSRQGHCAWLYLL